METDTIDQQEDQRRLLAESARAFAERELGPGRYRKLRQQPVQFDRGLWKSMADMGWTGLMLPESFGGHGLGMHDLTTVLEELGRRLIPEPLVSGAVFAGQLIAGGDNEPLKRRLLAGLVAGDLVPAVAFQEGLPAFGDITCRASDAKGGVTLSGTKRFVRPSSGADGFVVGAMTDRGFGLYWVASGTPGLSIDQETSADGGQAGRIVLRDLRIPAEDVLASPAAGQAAFDAALDLTLVACGAELVGLMRGALDMTLAYLRTRVQFGKPIGSFQALQHRAVDLYLQQELSAAAVAEVAAQFDADPAMPAPKRAAAASRVKARCSDAALLITREAIQMHGAIGFTDEYDVGFYLKRALVLSAWLGNSREHRLRYAAASGIGA